MADNTYWHKQTTDKPLFPDLLWSRPENKHQAGKLLIIGGNQYGFVAPSDAFSFAQTAGIGLIRMVLPDSLKSFTRGGLNGQLSPSTPSGSFAQSSLGIFIDESSWADAVLIAGDIGRNSETAILLEKFTSKYQGQLTLTKDAVNYFIKSPEQLLEREETTIITDVGKLQKMQIAKGNHKAIGLDMDFLRFVELLHELSLNTKANIITKHHRQIIVASRGQISSTKLSEDLPIWQVKHASRASVWWLQNPTKPFESLTTSVLGFTE